jgi:striatin 1/3/4
MILDTEAAVIANFEFLSQTDVDMDDDDDMSDDLEPPDDDDQDDVKTAKRKGKVTACTMYLMYLHKYKMALHV